MPAATSQVKHSVPPMHGPQIMGDGKPHIFIGTPAHDNRWHSAFGTSLMRFVAAVAKLPEAERFHITTSTVSSGGISKARNQLAWEFLVKTNASHLIFLDSDISFEPGDLLKLIADDLPIVGGLYSHKRPKLAWSAWAMEGVAPDPVTGLQELMAVGTGGVCIRRDVFETMIKTYPEIAYIETWPDAPGVTRWDFFSMGVVTDPEHSMKTPTWLSEDWFFFYRARKMGLKVFADTNILFGHWEGLTRYPLDGALEAAQVEYSPPPAPETKTETPHVNGEAVLTETVAR